MTTAGVLLAAGGGSRFTGDTHKLLARLGDTTLFDHALDAVVAAGFDEVIVVAGAVDLAEHLPSGRVTYIVNHVWQEGIATSVQAAVDEARRSHHDAIVVGLGDQPGVPTSAWQAVASASTTPIAVATYDGRRGNPVRLAAEVWPLLPTEGDEGARALMRARPELVTEVPCSGTAFDIDTVDELSRWTSSTADHGGTP